MGVPAWLLMRVMPESEFQAHRLQMAMDPDQDVRAVHLLKLLLQMSAGQINAWGGKIRINADHLDPWEAAKVQPGADERIALFAEMYFGVKESDDGGERRNPGAEAGR